MKKIELYASTYGQHSFSVDYVHLALVVNRKSNPEIEWPKGMKYAAKVLGEYIYTKTLGEMKKELTGYFI